MPTIMNQIKIELGENAIILQNKKMQTKGFLGFFKKDFIEVLAMKDTGGSNEKDNSPSGLRQHEKKQKNKKKSEINSSEINSSSEVRTDLQNAKIAQNMVSNYGESNAKVFSLPTIKTDEISQEIGQLKQLVNEMNQRIKKNMVDEEADQKEIFIQDKENKLIQRGMSESLSKKIIEKAATIDSDISDQAILKSLENYFSDKKYDFNQKQSNINHHVFIGPTGVGKTTTLAKLASNRMLKSNEKIGFITLDTYRISAIEQLKTYSQILACPIEVAYDLEDLKGALERLNSKDICYIDTAGRSHLNQSNINELEVILESIPNKQVFLVIAANYQLPVIIDMINQFSFDMEIALIITKMDETCMKGIIFDILDRSNHPIAYLAFGQNVPEDIEAFHMNLFINEFLMQI